MTGRGHATDDAVTELKVGLRVHQADMGVIEEKQGVLDFVFFVESPHLG